MGDKAAVEELTAEQQERYDLIVRNLQEVLGGDKIKKQISSGKNMHVYWGTATTGRPHVGYLVPMRKIADFLHADIKVSILFADLHAFLDNMKSTWELLENRVVYYEYVIKALLQSLNVPIEKLHFVRGTTYQLSKEYTFDILRLCGQVSQRDALRAGAEVVKQVESPLLSGLLYPLLQALDEQYLKVDGQFGGVDQRKIFILAEEQLPKLKLGKRWHLMNPMVPGLTGSKMSSSEADSKIDLLDAADLVARKISGADCERQTKEKPDNGVLAFYEHVLLPIVLPNSINVCGKDFFDIASIKESFENDVISADQLKETLHVFLNSLLAKVQQRCETAEIKAAIEKGYEAVPERKVISATHPEVELNDTQKTHLNAIVTGAEISNDDVSAIRVALSSDRPLKVIIPMGCKGKYHLGYIAPLLKIKALLTAGVKLEATVLLNDLEAFLDNEKVTWAARDGRTEYFRTLSTSVIKQLGLEKNVNVLRSSEMENNFSKEYVLEMYKMASAVTRDETALSEGTLLSGHLVPLIYALDVHYSNPDIVLLGNDSKPIADIARKLWSVSLGVAGPSQLLLPTVIGMDEQKMSASNGEFILDPLDTPKQIRQKIARSFCEPQNVQRNVALKLCEQVVFPLLEGRDLSILRKDENGGDLALRDFKALEHEFAVGSNSEFPLHPADFKNAVVEILNGFFDPIRAELSAQQTRLLAAAFPVNKGGKGGKKK